MLENSLYLITAVVGFITLSLIGFRYKTNRYSNLYLIIFLLLSSFRYLAHWLVNLVQLNNFARLIDILLATNAWPLLYLYFTTLVYHQNTKQKRRLFHFIIPATVFTFFCLQPIFTTEAFMFGRKIGFLLSIVVNLIYTVACYKLLSNNVWNRDSDIFVINQQNIIMNKWTKLLFLLFILMNVRFLINLMLNKNEFWYINQNNFLWVGALIWLVLYAKILYSPEFLYGYDVFQNKIKEYKKHNIIFDNIWLIDTSQELSCVQDTVLKEKIAPHIENYVLSIEHLAVNTNLFLSHALKKQDLAKKLNIPQSHLGYIFKYHASINFADFKKIIRIQKTILLIEEGFLNNNTMEALAVQTGFTSYSSFFKSFKSITGMSPQEYIKNQ